MDTDLLDRHLPARAVAQLRLGDDDADDDLGAFGWLRGQHERAPMLELRKKDGSILAYPYSWLEKARFDPSEGILLKFGVEKIKIIGRNLNNEIRPNVRLFSGIVSHRVPWIQEADRADAMAAGKGAVVIEAISLP